MKFWEIVYYKTKSFVNKKYFKCLTVAEAIKKARVKNIVDVIELTETEYLIYSK